jgi:hypothetical protein
VLFVALVKRTALSSGRIVARPARSQDMLASRKICSVGFEMSVENFFRKKIRKIPSGIPNHCRTFAASNAENSSKVIFKRSTWERGPQAVLKDSCLVNTLWGTGGVGQAPPGWLGERPRRGAAYS